MLAPVMTIFSPYVLFFCPGCRYSTCWGTLSLKSLSTGLSREEASYNEEDGSNHCFGICNRLSTQSEYYTP